MCGRYSDVLSWREMVELYRIHDEPVQGDLPLWNFAPSWNVAPTQRRPIVRVAAGDGARREVAIARWGMIPPWVKDPKEAGITTINAMAETLRSKPLYKKPFLERRCIVTATCWYEWEKLGPKDKQAYAIRPAQGGFGFAGLWNVWRGGDGVPVESYTIVTTDAAPSIAQIHRRMPRVLQGGEFDLWLGSDAEAAAELLKPSQAAFEFWKIGPRVGNWRNDDAEILNPL